MERVRVLFIFQEITPYLPETHLSLIGRNLPQGIQERGKEIRTFMPNYGIINERRHQLHEVIRLSGMNLIINDTDHPLIIKVASIQSARMQIYFIDNEDFFSRKYMLKDENNHDFADNDERLVFYNRGVIETIIKLNWSPHIIHCHGWFTSLLPLYIKKCYFDNPLFANTKIVYSLYDNVFTKPFRNGFKNKVIHDGITKKDIEILNEPNCNNIQKLAIKNSDGVIVAGNKIHPELKEYLKTSKKKTMNHEEPNYVDRYSEFYDQLLKE